MQNQKKIIVLVLTLIFLCSFLSFTQQKKEQTWSEQVGSYVTWDRTSDSNVNPVTNRNNTNQVRINYWSYFKIILGLGLVILAIYLIFYFVKKALKIKENTGADAQIITSQALGPGKWVQVVYIHGKYLILGVTNENINLIGEITDPKEIERLDIYSNQQAVENKGKSFQDLFNDLKNRIFNKQTQKEDKFDYEKDELSFLKEQQNRMNNINEKQENDNEN